MYDSSFGWRFVNPRMKEQYGVDAMGETAENLAEQFSISREAQDEFALRSQHNYETARKQGYFQDEIVSVEIPSKKGPSTFFAADEFPKPASNMESLSSLKAAFRKNGTVTAGNASGLNDGSVALLIAGEKAVSDYSLKPLARIVAAAASGVAPRVMGIGPVEASLKALQNAGLTLSQMDLIELNEAFAAQVLSCLKQWGLSAGDPRVNPVGGAIAMGHPLGMSGGRILLTAARQLQLSGKRYALVTMCVGVGQGYAVIIERV